MLTTADNGSPCPCHVLLLAADKTDTTSYGQKRAAACPGRRLHGNPTDEQVRTDELQRVSHTKTLTLSILKQQLGPVCEPQHEDGDISF